jgi:hypothetical protein
VERPAATQSSVQQVRRLVAAHARRELGQGFYDLMQKRGLVDAAWEGARAGVLADAAVMDL